MGQSLLIINLLIAGINILDPIIRPNIGINKIRRNFTFWLISLLITWFYFIFIVITRDFDYTYVVDHVAQASPSWQVLVSVFSAGIGAMFFWCIAIAVFAFIVIRKINQVNFIKYFLRIVFSFEIFLLIFFSINNLFAYSNGAIDGFGVNPILQTVWAGVHPILLFGGYANIFILFCIITSDLLVFRMITHTKIISFFTYLSLLLLGSGLLSGGIWAYQTPGWAGWWSWDPVEVSALLPFVLLQYNMKKLNCENSRFSAFLLLLPFIFVLFSAMMIRSGIFSNYSIHSYSGSNQIAVLVIGIISILFLSLAIIAAVRSKSTLTKRRVDYLLIGVMLIAAYLFLAMLSYAIPELANIIAYDFDSPFDSYVRILIPIVSLMLVAGIFSNIRRCVFSLKLLGFLFISIISGVGIYFYGISDLLLFCFIELIISYFVSLLLVVITSNIRNISNDNKSRNKLVKFSTFIYSVGFGILISASLISHSYNIVQDYIVEDGDIGEIQKKQVLFSNIDIEKNSLLIEYKHDSNLLQNKNFTYKGVDGTLYDNVIYCSVKEDLHFLLRQIDNESDVSIAHIVVMIYPLMFWVWLGSGLMFLGIVIKITKLPRR